MKQKLFIDPFCESDAECISRNEYVDDEGDRLHQRQVTAPVAQAAPAVDTAPVAAPVADGDTWITEASRTYTPMDIGYMTGQTSQSLGAGYLNSFAASRPSADIINRLHQLVQILHQQGSIRFPLPPTGLSSLAGLLTMNRSERGS